MKSNLIEKIKHVFLIFIRLIVAFIILAFISFYFFEKYQCSLINHNFGDFSSLNLFLFTPFVFLISLFCIFTILLITNFVLYFPFRKSSNSLSVTLVEAFLKKNGLPEILSHTKFQENVNESFHIIKPYKVYKDNLVLTLKRRIAQSLIASIMGISLLFIICIGYKLFNPPYIFIILCSCGILVYEITTRILNDSATIFFNKDKGECFEIKSTCHKYSVDLPYVIAEIKNIVALQILSMNSLFNNRLGYELNLIIVSDQPCKNSHIRVIQEDSQTDIPKSILGNFNPKRQEKKMQTFNWDGKYITRFNIVGYRDIKYVRKIAGEISKFINVPIIDNIMMESETNPSSNK